MIDIVKIPNGLPCDSVPANIFFFKKAGDRVSPGDPLFSYEFDGALFTESSVCSGKILAVFLADGDMATEGTPALAISKTENYL